MYYMFDKPKRIEDETQKAFVKWFRLQYPQVLMYATENAGQRTFAKTNYLKSMGMLPGVPDIFIAQPNKEYAGYYIEFKAGKNKPTDHQIAFKNKVEAAGYKWSCFWDITAAALYVDQYLKNR